MKRMALALTTVVLSVWAAGRAAGQSSQSAPPAARPMIRVSLFTNSSQSEATDGTKTAFRDLSTAFSYQLPDLDANGADYGVDVRHAMYAATSRPSRVSIYEGFIGARLADGAVRFRLGHLWLSDLGSLGSVAGGLFEVRSRRFLPEDGRFRAGVFSGLDPNIFATGYADNVKKTGGYVAYDGSGARRHSIGYVMVRNASLTERSVVSTTNFLPVGRKLFVYQAAEYDVGAPAGQAQGGLAYLFATARVLPTDRVEFQGTYNRGRSVDARGLSEDVLAGRPITQQAVEGLLYESIGGRATVEVVPRVRVYGGYSVDKNNRDTDPTNRFLVGGYASNIAESGVDVTVSDSLMDRPTGSYHSFYVSVGHQVKRNAYVSGDYSTSLSVVRFSRSDGITIETRPQTRRFSGTATINAGRSASLLATVERSLDDQVNELRVMTGITYRFR